MKKLAIVTTHPIQYNAPWFKLLADRSVISPKVFYTWEQAFTGQKYDPGFGKTVEWDIPLLDGYDFTFVKNVAEDPGSHHFKGMINPTLIEELRSWNPDAILVFTWAHYSHLKVLRYFKGKVPILFRGDSTLIDSRSILKSIFRNFVLTWVYKKVDVALYVGENNKAYYRKYGMPEKKLYHVPHAIDNDRFSNQIDLQISEANKKREQLGIGLSDFVFLFAGKFEVKKNPELLIAAFQKIAKPNVHLILVGNGELEIELKARYKDIGNIHFIDFQNQSIMPQIYQMCNVFVLPSRGPEETWGLAVNEAMACKKAVLVSNKCGGFPDLVDEGKNGFVFMSDDIFDLSSKMNKLILKENVKEMGLYSFQKIQDFTFANICERIEHLLIQKNVSQ